MENVRCPNLCCNGQEVVQVPGTKAFNTLEPCPVCEGKGVVPKKEVSFLVRKWGL